MPSAGRRYRNRDPRTLVGTLSGLWVLGVFLVLALGAPDVAHRSAAAPVTWSIGAAESVAAPWLDPRARLPKTLPPSYLAHAFDRAALRRPATPVQEVPLGLAPPVAEPPTGLVRPDRTFRARRTPIDRIPPRAFEARAPPALA